MKVSQRTIKIVLATVISIWVAQALGLQNPYAAGVVAILSVLDTRRDTLRTAAARFGSTLLAFAIGTLIFSWLGFTVIAFGWYLMVYIPLAYRLRLQDGIAPCSVLVTHFILAESTSWTWQINGLSLMAIGLIVALVFQIWMPSYAKQLTKLKDDIEIQMRQTLTMMGDVLLDPAAVVPEIVQGCRWLTQLLDRMNQLALSEFDNQLFSESDYYLRYVKMRQEQVQIMQQMMRVLPNIELSTQANPVVARLYHETADQFHEHNTGISLLEDISELYGYFRDSDLPQTREEFESRAMLFHLLTDFERFLEVKRDFFIEIDQTA